LADAQFYKPRFAGEPRTDLEIADDGHGIPFVRDFMNELCPLGHKMYTPTMSLPR
jgi:hypothetical protein